MRNLNFTTVISLVRTDPIQSSEIFCDSTFVYMWVQAMSMTSNFSSFTGDLYDVLNLIRDSRPPGPTLTT